ncbi:MAG: DEAD/DEAH box helicase [Candidatus Omnitrophica bacterium]|nr:DEAD/DEAH box helicase [Candidatus Omnitrophota bacterium]MDD5429663.1 DEAD/DEAH box helicase [Candidatus Omnitrophota bacterium]
MQFSELNLPQSILKSLQRMGFKELTPIQEATYPIILTGRDICALAETGSGKTSACAIPLIQIVDSNIKSIQGLVIVPTRELCIQYVDEIHKIALKTQVAVFAAYGGFDKSIQVTKLKHGVHILVATPGRLIDLIYDGVVDLTGIKCVILDEADRLLDDGFLEGIELILSCIRQEHQILMFSATMNEETKKLANDCLKNPKHISLINKQATPKSIEHYFAYVKRETKEKALFDYLRRERVNQAIIFCNARSMVDTLHRIVRKHFRDVEYIHAGLEQGKRSSIVRRFRAKKIRYLIATDVAGRGLDFSHISHIVNWNFPRGEQYTHRTGRVGRMGRKGRALSLITHHDIPAVREMLSATKIKPHWFGIDPLSQLSAPHRSSRRPPRG